MTRCADSSCKSLLLNHLHEGTDSLSLSQQCLSTVFIELRSFPEQTKKILNTCVPRKVPQHLKSGPTVDRYRKLFNLQCVPTSQPLQLGLLTTTLGMHSNKFSTPSLSQYEIKETSLLRLRQKPPLQAIQSRDPLSHCGRALTTGTRHHDRKGTARRLEHHGEVPNPQQNLKFERRTPAKMRKKQCLDTDHQRFDEIWRMPAETKKLHNEFPTGPT